MEQSQATAESNWAYDIPLSQHTVFDSPEQAYTEYQKISPWTIDDINPQCLSKAAFLEFASEIGLEDTLQEKLRERLREKLRERAGLLLSLGIKPAKVATFLTERDPDRHSVSTASFIKKLRYFHEVLGVSRARLCRLLTSHTRLCDYSLERTIVPRVKFWQEYLQIDVRSVGRLAYYHPRILWAHMELDVEVKIRLLAGLLGDPKHVPAVIRYAPAIIALSELTIMEKVTQLVRMLDLTPEELPRVLKAGPGLLTRDLGKIIPQCMATLSRYLGPQLTRRLIVYQSPQLLALRPGTIVAKLKFLLEEVGYEPKEVASNSSLLAMSLANRLRPRYEEYLRVVGTLADAPRMPASLFMVKEQAFYERLTKLSEKADG